MNNVKSKINIHGLEINISEQCNLSCKGCDHGMDVIASRQIPLQVLFRDIKEASQYFHAKTLRIIGGEPLLHPDLAQIIFEFKTINISNSIELWTNGLLLDKVSKTNWEFLDGIVISKYPKIPNSWNSSTLRSIIEEYKVWINIRECNTFSWSMNLKKNKRVTAKILHNSCRESATCNTIRNGKFYKCVQSAFAKDRLFSSGIIIEDDGIELHDTNISFENFENHLWSNNPINACYYCFGEFGAKFPHKQITDCDNDNSEKRFDDRFIIP